ncbi:MAG: vWA domain-containing protein [Patescibacteria group bacterium]
MDAIREFIANIKFLEYTYLWLLCLVAILSLLWTAVAIRKRLKTPLRTHLSRYPIFPRIKFWLAATLVALLTIVALGRPFREGGENKLKAGGVDVISIIDRSLSMGAEDINPSRLEAAKKENLELAEKILRPGDRVSVFAFGKDSFRKLYLSNDVNRFTSEVARIRLPKRLKGEETVWDTNLALTLEHVYQSLDIQDSFDALAHGAKGRHGRIVFIFTDGDDRINTRKQLGAVASEFRRRNIKVFAIGVGTRRGYPLLSILSRYKKGEDYDEEVEKEWRGERTRLETKSLEYVARATGGQLFTIEDEGGSAKAFIEKAINSQRSFSVVEENKTEIHTEYWRYAVIAALILLALAIIFY